MRTGGHGVVRFARFIASVALAASFTGSIAAVLPTNGGFETGDLTGWTSMGNRAVVGTTSLPSRWQDTDEYGNPVNYPNDPYGYFVTDPSVAFSPYSGNFMLGIGSHTAATNYAGGNRVAQAISGAGLHNPYLSFAFNMWSFDYGNFDRFSFGINYGGGSVTLGQFNAGYVSPDGEPPTLNSSGWHLVSFDLTPYLGANGSDFELWFGAGETGDTAMRTRTGVFIDAVRIGSAPEPTTLALLGLGLAGLAATRRRKQ